MHFSKNGNPVGMTGNNIHKILIANRGEIALRIIRAIHSLDKRAVVIHSEPDRDLPFVTSADEAYTLGSGALADTYLNQEKMIRIAREAHVDAIHPGYGFMAENSSFAAACRENHIQFIGPSPEAIEVMGDKSRARETARKLGLPVLDGMVDDLEGLIRIRETLPYPLLVKPSAGGGGKGMRIVHRAEQFEEAAREAAREAESYFGSGSLYVEKYLEDPRHIEVQVIADNHGHAVHLFERECSLQRRYQKIIEEAPSISVTGKVRDAITASALRLVKGIGYTNAGTVEFLMDSDQAFYFLEMNTRIQVEHPVTEMITGIDLVREQINIAEGHPLSFSQEEVMIRGHSIEARIYSEDPEKNFMPSTGRIGILHQPEGPGTRVDSGLAGGCLLEPHYDPLIAKVIVVGSNRDNARNQLISALKEFHITGIKTNRDFLMALVRSESYTENRIHTGFVDSHLEQLLRELEKGRKANPEDVLVPAAALIALRSVHSQQVLPSSPWNIIGHWRIVPEIILQDGDRHYRIRYELLKGRERMKIHLDEHMHEVYLEENAGNDYRIRIDHHVLHIWGTTDRSEVILDVDGHLYSYRRPDILDERYMGSGSETGTEQTDMILAPLSGRIVQINNQEGDEVKKGETLLVIESMKMENKVLAPRQTVLRRSHVSVGEQVRTNQLLFTLDPYDRSSDK
jgi:3-methylcrotonyl-CoA carboxylase alpha subunit